MTDENISLEVQLENTKKEIETLKSQASNTSQGVNALLAQLDAHKQMLNDSLNTVVQLRTQLILCQKRNAELEPKPAA